MLMLLTRTRVLPLIVTRNRFSTATSTDGREVYLEKMTDTGISVLVMNRPAVKNALGKEFTQQFSQILDTVHSDKEIRVLILRSNVKNIFCAGADLKERLKMSEHDVPLMSQSYRETFQRLFQLPCPTIAALDGHALGGGLEMALACDLRVAASNAKIGLVETQLAIIPGAGGTQRLPRLVGLSKAKELIFTSAILQGEEAERIGLVNIAVQQNVTFDAAFLKAMEVAKKISTKGPIAIRAAKLALNRGMDVSLEKGLVIEGTEYQVIVPTKDRIEGLIAFSEKRVPIYKGN